MRSAPSEVPSFLHEFALQTSRDPLNSEAAVLATEVAPPILAPEAQTDVPPVGRWRSLVNRIHRLNSQVGHQQVSRETEVASPPVDAVAFYNEQAHRWAEAPYTPEDLATLFAPEHLSSLTLDQYALLMRRFPGELVTHVTRQGIRDHSGMVYHTEGVGAYNDGFKNMLADRRLRSPLGVYMVEEEKEAAIARFLRLERYKDKQQALDKIESITYLHPNVQAEAGSYADRNAIHFAAQEVGDQYYGSERGNEIFIAFPAAMIASQYHFNGDLTDSSGGYWNDLWVWEQEQQGIPLDAGLIFIPANAQVDRNTGSRYQIDASGNPIRNIADMRKIEQILEWPELQTFSQEVSDARYHQADTDNDFLLPFRAKLVDQFGITDPTLQDAILDDANLTSLAVEQQNTAPFEEMRNELVSGVLATAQKEYLPAEDPISSQEYWEHYFAQTGWRPSKVVFYEGEDPTAAMRRWRAENNIGKRSSDPYFGFDNHHIRRGHDVAIQGMDRFRSLALSAIENHFEDHKA